jgi:hypothetical protein
LQIDNVIAEEWGRMGAKRPISTVNGLLAATAIVHKMTLVTRNTGDVIDLGAKIINPFKQFSTKLLMYQQKLIKYSTPQVKDISDVSSPSFVTKSNNLNSQEDNGTKLSSRIKPQVFCDFEWFNPLILPPLPFVPTHVKLVMVGCAEWDCELVGHFASESAGLREAQMVSL